MRIFSRWLAAGAAAVAAPVLAEVPLMPVGELTATNEMVLSTAQDRLTRMTVEVYVNGQGPFPFAIDTGADRTVISESLARRLGLSGDGQAQLHGVAGVDRVQTTRLSSLKVGAKEVADIRAPILPDSALGAAGLLGIDAVAGQRVTMDFVDKQMTVRPAAFREASDRDPDTITITAKRRFGQLVLVNASVNGQKVYAIIDSGSQVTIGNPKLRQMLVRREKGDEVSTELVSVTGRRIAANYGMLPRMKIGDVIVGDVPILYSDAHPFKRYRLHNKPAMLIGVDILRAFERVSLDYDRKKVRFSLKSEKIS